MKFIHAADLHVDSPLRGLERYEGAPVEEIRNSTRKALAALVDLVIAEKVDLLLLAGDIFDGDWADYRTGLYFRNEMVRATKAGVKVFIAKGNHDADSQISKSLPPTPGVYVFSSAKCETLVFEDLGVAVHGRSYPKRHVTEDLASTYSPAVAGLFNIGVLHTSLAGYPDHDLYAPTSVNVLCELGYDYVALGHIHTRDVIRTADPRIVFPGNLQGRHAKEIGPKGCELVSVENGKIISADFVPLDVVRWHQVQLDATGVTDLEGLRVKFLEHAETITSDACDRLHAVRVYVAGETPLHGLEAEQPGTLAAAIQAASQDFELAPIWVEKTFANVRSPIDRASAAKREDPVGEVARLAAMIASDEEKLREFMRQHLGELGMLPGDLAKSHPTTLSAEDLRQVLADAEATVLAQLSEIFKAENNA